MNLKTPLILLGALSFPSVYAHDNSGTREVLLNNDKVEVVRLTYPPGTESGMHTHVHPNRTVYFVQGGKLELVPKDPNETSKILEVSAGKLLFLLATTHNVKNIGETEVVLIENEIK